MFSFILVEKYAHWSREWNHFKFCFLNTDHVMLSGEFFICLCGINAYISMCWEWKFKETIPWSIVRWSVSGKQNVQAKEVYCTAIAPTLGCRVSWGPFVESPESFRVRFAWQFSLCLQNEGISRHETLQLFLLLFPLQQMKRPALQNWQVGVLWMAFWARKFFGLSRNGPLVRCDFIVSRKTFNRNMMEIDRVG